ncbi:MAG: hypothetical protein HOG89_02825 [Candidatus Peribacter sp.]|jgi:hypothetical protein|nr:hypothetical protein [Candidatus Peribacter sp.]MBT4392707.1 hypothetical protein [Candidatus Peribacter sp.]MBT4600676.1 hypothetical protein [Candidatus Peribacter sp.]MBT5148655.1 hypothetical protein [Candidatus Peribacter sp.]MBT5637750.1 hypothetical protein [Candidatus Peribacter sp.]
MGTLYSFIIAYVPAAYAIGRPCDYINNCGVGFNPLPRFATVAAAALLEIVSGLAVLFVVIGGALLVLNFGNESQSEKGKKAIVFSLIGWAIALSSQAIISFSVARAGTIDYLVPHLSIMRVMVGSMLFVFNVVFALMMLFYGYKLVFARGQQSELDAVKKALTMTIAGAIAINISYALVRATAQLGF